ncbi:MAG: adenosine deaminase [Candidatus Eisenbacteria bacterium]|nr:adenosine deaminase [Candidatus Eisenbacteria bacterium]
MNRFERIPKAELHVHLEGAIPLDTFWELIEERGGDPSVPDRDSLRERFRYRDFPHFLETWTWKNGFLRDHAAFERIAEAVARNLHSQNILYAELHFSPSDFHRFGLETGRIAEAVRAGLNRAPETETALILDLVRDGGPERALHRVAEAAELKDLGVIGIGLGGTEAEHPPEPFAPAFEEARRRGLRTTVHAGEGAGPESVRGALEALRPDRIGHAARAAEDPGVLDLLALRRVPVEACPGSNLRTGVIPRLAAHPIRLFLDRGVPVSVNTDDPALFGNSLAGEFAALEEEPGFPLDRIHSLILKGIRSSWLPRERKREMETRFRADPAWSA